MVISYFGSGCFRLESGELSLLVDPASNRFKGDIVLRTIMLTESEIPASGEITFPGEYESKGINITGWPLSAESGEKYLKTVYAVDWDGVRFVFLGHISKPIPSEIGEALGEPDVLFLPTGDEHFIRPEEAVKIAKRLEPSLVIPGYYKSAGEFLKAMGQKCEPQEKLVFKKKDLADKKKQVVILEPQ